MARRGRSDYAHCLRRPSADRVAVAFVAGMLAVFFGPAICTLRNPAPVGRTIWGVKRRLDRDLPEGTSMDSAVAYLNRLGVRYMIDSDHEISGWEDGVQAQWPLESGLIFDIYFDMDKRVRRDTVCKRVIFP